MSLKVLIVDDDASFRKLLQLRLKSFLKDIELTQFDTVAKAREFLRSGVIKFDLALLDQHLPDGRGTELLTEGWFEDVAVLAVSSDDSPEIPGASVLAGATFFLNKMNVSEPLFEPLVQGILDRTRLLKELRAAKDNALVIDTVKTLVNTLRHEINNPLGAVLGAAYIMRTNKNATEEQKEAAGLVESSGQRIKHVLDELCKAVALDPLKKAHEKVFHVPGDKPWGKEDE